ncbi:Nif11-like leader peptide family natural product precursor [Aphanizomenon sp. PH219]|nr:Nif11-like leader peptide family natural product precursor [Aphanizomenon sp. 202]MDK2461014.1 Nif11-like leader peptide family natural product precursor [Aphanizomenon sp. PH219]
MSLENVKAFYEKLAADDDFRNQIQSVENKEECSRIVKAAGFDFTLEEYEEYTYQLLESAAGEGEIQDLGEKELAAVFGGITGGIKIQPLYGVVRWPPVSQPLYGIVIDPTATHKLSC